MIAGVACVLWLAVLRSDTAEPVCNRIKFVNEIVHSERIDLALELCLALFERHRGSIRSCRKSLWTYAIELGNELLANHARRCEAVAVATSSPPH